MTGVMKFHESRPGPICMRGAIQRCILCMQVCGVYRSIRALHAGEFIVKGSANVSLEISKLLFRPVGHVYSYWHSSTAEGAGYSVRDAFSTSLACTRSAVTEMQHRGLVLQALRPRHLFSHANHDAYRRTCLSRSRPATVSDLINSTSQHRLRTS